MKPAIFTVSCIWDDEASVWSGRCDDIPAAADVLTLDELFDKISAIALDQLPGNHPSVQVGGHRFFLEQHGDGEVAKT